MRSLVKVAQAINGGVRSLPAERETLNLNGGYLAGISVNATAAMCVRREKAALSCGFQSHPAKAPAGSNRSGHGGNDMAEAFG